MTLLSLFMTSTGIFCFVPISQRLIESGIVSASNNWWVRRMPSALAPTPYEKREDKLGFLLATDDAEDAWSDKKILFYSGRDSDTFSVSQQPVTPCADDWCPVILSSREGSLTHSPIATFYGHESTSFTSDSTLCDSCDALLRREIPSDHIPSVIRALELFEAQDRLSGVIYDEYEMAVLTDAFSLLQI